MFKAFTLNNRDGQKRVSYILLQPLKNRPEVNLTTQISLIELWLLN